MYDLIIIGSGPAGLGAAIYGKRAGYSTLVLEKNPMSGGQVLNTCEVDNYLGLPGINGFVSASRPAITAISSIRLLVVRI